MPQLAVVQQLQASAGTVLCADRLQMWLFQSSLFDIQRPLVMDEFCIHHSILNEWLHMLSVPDWLLECGQFAA